MGLKKPGSLALLPVEDGSMEDLYQRLLRASTSEPPVNREALHGHCDPLFEKHDLETGFEIWSQPVQGRTPVAEVEPPAPHPHGMTGNASPAEFDRTPCPSRKKE
jgi:hypothetical protein